ncbi:MAG: hypothetical protein GXP30_09750 [Verrucomicrobia bacterium]|nr:hypothetical protein [Verrucomicrobiota bacterium]
MKILRSFILVLLSSANFCLADDTFSTVPLTSKDLTDILKLNVNKVRIDFEKAGYPTLEVKALSGPLTIKLPHSSKSATLMTYLERAPYAAKSGLKHIDTLHFWFTNEHGGTHSYFQFAAEQTNYTTLGLKDGVYTITSYKSKKDKDVIGYSMRITSQK